MLKDTGIVGKAMVSSVSANISVITERLNAILDTSVNASQIVGAVVVVAYDGDVIYKQAAGWANREVHQPMQAESAQDSVQQRGKLSHLF
jgi:hypothetical protein